MPDDLDDLDAVLRRTMASLDRQTPEGYFDALPARTLARLDDAATGEPLEAPKLDDVRELASETRARLSAQRGDVDDQLAASSAVWKAVALPAASASDAGARASAEASPPTSQPVLSQPVISQPAMASQPAPSQPATGSEDHATPAARWAVSQPPAASRSPGAAASSPSPPASSTELATQRPASRGGRRAAWVAIAGGLAAAGVVGYLAVGKHEAGDAMLVAEGTTRVASVPSGAAATPSTPAPTEAASARAAPGDAGMAIATGSTADEGRGGTASGSSRAAGNTDGRLAIELPRPGPSRDANVGSSRAHQSAGKSSGPPQVATLDKLGSAKKEPRPAAKRADAGKASAKGDVPGPSPKGALIAKGAVDPFDSGKPIDNLKPGGPPSSGAAAGSASGSAQVPLDQLLGESGSAKPAPVKAKPERTSLSSDDIKRGMAAVARKAQACFAGTQGLAPVRLTVAPSGRVTKATVSGMFAGSPTGACVERAVRAARFPAWDGGPQSFNYNYLLSD